jgi:hypothetical protein
MNVIVLHGQGGFELLSADLEKEEQETLLFNVVKVLRSRGHISAADLVERIPFEIYQGTNDFGDEFSVFFAYLPLTQYEEMRKLHDDKDIRSDFAVIASTITEIGPYIRFVGCDLLKDPPDSKWKRAGDSHFEIEEKSQKKFLPVALCAVVNDALGGTHATLNAVFRRAGLPGDPPGEGHATKWKTWLLRANEDPDIDAHRALGKVLEEFMEVEPPEAEISVQWNGQNFTSAREFWSVKKEKVENTLLKYGLRYSRGGRISETGTGLASEVLAQVLEHHDFDTLEVEFRRAIQMVSEDPGGAVTAGCALLEALFKAFLEEKGVDLPTKEAVKPLWSLAQKELGLDPKDQTDSDIQRILTGMISVVDGIGALRTHAGSAHGGGKLRYRVKPRHARLLINSAHTLALFLIETWKKRE